MFEGQLDTAAFIVTGGSVAFALAVALASHQLHGGLRRARARWAARAEELEWKVDRYDAILAAHPGIVLVWEAGAPLPVAPPPGEDGEGGEEDGEAEPSAKGSKPATDWGRPRLFGSPQALAAILRFADASDGPDAGSCILDGIVDYDAVDAAGEASTLRRRLEALRTDGSAFSLTIDGPQGRRIEADGRPAGRRVVLWLADAAVKSMEVTGVKTGGRDGEPGVDPVAFVDLLSKAPFPVFRLSSGLKLQWANRTYLDVVEVRSLADAVQRDTPLDAWTKDQARRALEAGERADDVREVTTGGERRVFAISIFPISGGFAGMAVDITSERRAREALERHAGAQDEALNYLRDAVAIFSSEKELVFHNRAFRTLFDLEESWLNQRPTHGEILDRLRERRLIPDQENYKAFRAGELAGYARADAEPSEDAWTLPDERMLRVARIRHPLGGMLLIFDDMTREIALETEYNTLIKVQRATLDRLNEAVAVFGTDGKLKLHNAAFETVWRIAPGELATGEPFDKVVERCMTLFADRETWAQMKARVTDVSPETRRAASGEIRRADDSVLAYLQRPLPDGSTVIAFHDITAARQLEAAMKAQAEALATADRVKSRFVENVSYHLRTPLTSVTGFAQLLSVTAADKLTDSESSQLEAILQAGEDLNKLVENIIVIAAIEAGKIELNLEEVEVRPVLEGALNMVKTSEVETRVRLAVNCPREVGGIRADPLRLKQALYNIIVNALDHTSPGGSIEIGAARIGSAVRVWVEDDGEGIPLERQGHVFEAFETDGRRGAGLGLTLVRKFVEMHNGMLDIESTPGVGTRVTMYLPVNPEKAAAKTRTKIAED